eukprot:SAG31_NODE_14662_length_793_cov_2.220461_1_plen_57_part_00
MVPNATKFAAVLDRLLGHQAKVNDFGARTRIAMSRSEATRRQVKNTVRFEENHQNA